MHPHDEWTLKLKEGDTVYMVNRWGQSAPRQARVTKVGTKWLYLTLGERIDRRTGRLHDCHSWDLFRDAGSHTHHLQIAGLWQRLYHHFGKPYPPGTTEDKLREIARLAGLELAPKNSDSQPTYKD